MIDDEKIVQLSLTTANKTKSDFTVDRVWLLTFARSVYALGMDAGRDEIERLRTELAEAHSENAEQARLLGISGSVEARLLARVAELERELTEAKRDAERWNDIAGFAGAYQVSTKGRVRSVARTDSDGNRRAGMIMTPSAIRKGYLKVSLWAENAKQEKYVHRLVAETFIANPSSLPQVNHKDGDPANNEVGNLEWVTNAQNQTHARRVLARGVRAVYGVNSNGVRVDFQSLQHAVEAGFVRANIQKCIAGKRNTHRGFQWFDAEIDRARGAA